MTLEYMKNAYEGSWSGRARDAVEPINPFEFLAGKPVYIHVPYGDRTVIDVHFAPHMDDVMFVLSDVNSAWFNFFTMMTIIMMPAIVAAMFGAGPIAFVIALSAALIEGILGLYFAGFKGMMSAAVGGFAEEAIEAYLHYGFFKAAIVMGVRWISAFYGLNLLVAASAVRPDAFVRSWIERGSRSGAKGYAPPIDCSEVVRRWPAMSPLGACWKLRVAKEEIKRLVTLAKLIWNVPQAVGQPAPACPWSYRAYGQYSIWDEFRAGRRWIVSRRLARDASPWRARRTMMNTFYPAFETWSKVGGLTEYEEKAVVPFPESAFSPLEEEGAACLQYTTLRIREVPRDPNGRVRWIELPFTADVVPARKVMLYHHHLSGRFWEIWSFNRWVRPRRRAAAYVSDLHATLRSLARDGRSIPGVYSDADYSAYESIMGMKMCVLKPKTPPPELEYVKERVPTGGWAFVPPNNIVPVTAGAYVSSVLWPVTSRRRRHHVMRRESLREVGGERTTWGVRAELELRCPEDFGVLASIVSPVTVYHVFRGRKRAHVRDKSGEGFAAFLPPCELREEGRSSGGVVDTQVYERSHVTCAVAGSSPGLRPPVESPVFRFWNDVCVGANYLPPWERTMIYLPYSAPGRRGGGFGQFVNPAGRPRAFFFAVTVLTGALFLMLWWARLHAAIAWAMYIPFAALDAMLVWYYKLRRIATLELPTAFGSYLNDHVPRRPLRQSADICPLSATLQYLPLITLSYGFRSPVSEFLLAIGTPTEVAVIRGPRGLWRGVMGMTVGHWLTECLWECYMALLEMGWEWVNQWWKAHGHGFRQTPWAWVIDWPNFGIHPGVATIGTYVDVSTALSQTTYASLFEQAGQGAWADPRGVFLKYLGRLVRNLQDGWDTIEGAFVEDVRDLVDEARSILTGMMGALYPGELPGGPYAFYWERPHRFGPMCVEGGAYATMLSFFRAAYALVDPSRYRDDVFGIALRWLIRPEDLFRLKFHSLYNLVTCASAVPLEDFYAYYAAEYAKMVTMLHGVAREV